MGTAKYVGIGNPKTYLKANFPLPEEGYRLAIEPLIKRIKGYPDLSRRRNVVGNEWRENRGIIAGGI